MIIILIVTYGAVYVHITFRYVFDNLSCDQAEDLLWQHGADGTYLVSHFHDPESYGMSIRIRYLYMYISHADVHALP